MDQRVPGNQDSRLRRLGNYRLVRMVSDGGMARVFEARRDGEPAYRRLALKVIRPDLAKDLGFRRLFMREAAIGARLRHPNLMRIRGVNRDGAHLFLVMDFIHGLTLRQLVQLCRENGVVIPLKIVAELGRQACAGLQHLHSARGGDGLPLGLVHSDVKPVNLMLDWQGQVKVLDFGITRGLADPAKAGFVIGTWGYMAPEQARDEDVGPATDQFGLAAVLYELATLEPLLPERGAVAAYDALVADRARERVARLCGAYEPLADILVRALAPLPARRFPSMAAFEQALAGFVDDYDAMHVSMLSFVDSMATLSELEEMRRFSLDAETPTSFSLPAVDVRGLAAAQARLAAHAPAPVAPAPVAPRPVRPSVPGRRVMHPAPPPAAPRIATLFLAAFALVLTFLGLTFGGGTFDACGRSPLDLAVSPADAAGLGHGAVQDGALVGLLTLGSYPRAQVIVDGEFLGWGPIHMRRLAPGRHHVTLVSAADERHAFQVELGAGEELRRVWDFEQAAWAE